MVDSSLKRTALCWPRGGYTKHGHKEVLEHTKEHKITRYRTEWRWWVPYFMVWYVTNDRDLKEIFLREGEEPPAGAVIS